MARHHNFKRLAVGTGFRSPLSQLCSRMFLIILLIASVAMAEPDPGQRDIQESGTNNPAEGANQGSYTGNIGDNINLFDGSLSLSAVDVFLPGRAGLDLMLARQYNSSIFFRQDVAAGSYNDNSWGATKPHGCLGDGWDMTIGRVDPVTKTVFYGDGTSEEYFANSGEGVSLYPWRTISGNRLNTNISELRLLNGMRYIYGKNCTSLSGADTVFRGYYLTQIIDVFGNRDSIIYDSSSTFPFIDSIYDALNRVVDFQYTGTDRWRKLSKIKYYNYKDSSPDSLGVTYHYNDTTKQLSYVKYPNGDSILYGYTNTVLNPLGGSRTLSDSTRVLSAVKTTRGGEVNYIYKLFQEQREERIDSTCVHDTTILDIWFCLEWDVHPLYKYVNHWSVYQRSARSCSNGTSETTTFAHALGDYSAEVEIGEDDGGDAVRHMTTVATPLGETIEYFFSINTDIRDWYKSGNLSYYYRDTSDDVVKPGGLHFARSSMYGNGGIWKFLRYHCVSFSADNSAPYLIIPAAAQDTRNGGAELCTIWSPAGSCTYVPFPNVPFDTSSSTATYKKVKSSDDSQWNTNAITGSSFDSTSNIYRVTQRTVTDYKDGMTETVVTDYHYSSDLNTLDWVTVTRGGKSVTDSLEYDVYGNVTKSYDANGFYTEYVYDNTYHAFVTETKRQVDDSTVMTVGKAAYYWRAGLPIWTSGPNNDTTFYAYDNYNRLTSTKLPLESDRSSVRIYVPDSNIVIDSMKTIGGESPKWRVTRTKYDGFNHVVASRLAADDVYYQDSTEYDCEGRLRKAYRTWDTSNPPNPLPYTQYNYDVLGRVVKTISPTPDADSIRYIDFYTTEAIAASGRRVRTVTDFSGNVIATYSNYADAAYKDTSTSTYLPFGKRRSTTPPKGDVYKDTLAYDAFGNVSARYNPDEGVKQYYYNKLGQPRLAKDAANTWSYFKYDGLGRITEQGVVTNPDTTQIWTNNSYPASNTSQKITKWYDAYTADSVRAYRDSALMNPKGLLTEVYDPTGYNYFFYDERGRVLKKVTYVNGDTIRIHRYTYHPGDMVDSMYYPRYSGATVDTMNAIQYAYKDYGWVRGVSGYAATINYEPSGAVSLMHLRPSSSQNTLIVSFGYDTTGRLTNQFVYNTVPNNDDAVFRQSYTYTGGDISRANKTDTLGNYFSTAQRYTYDAVGRLSTAVDSSLSTPKSYRYVHDKNGNIDSMVVNGSPIEYTYQNNSNRLLRSQWGAVADTFAYNANGCLWSDPQNGPNGTILLQDHRNLDTLVTQMRIDGGMMITDTLRFLYDHTGRRGKKTAITREWFSPCTKSRQLGSTEIPQSGSAKPPQFGSTKVPDIPGDTIIMEEPDPCDPYLVRYETNTYYYYSGSEVSLVVRRSSGYPAFWTINIYAAGKKIATGDYYMGGTFKKRFEVSDYQGNLRNVFYYDPYNNLQLGEAIWYNPFGKQDSVLVVGIGLQRFTYNGKELDWQLGLDRYYYGARYYDPQIGRFMTPDPIKDDWTPYSYCRNNPIMYNDPTGMASYTFMLDPALVTSGDPEPKGPRGDPFSPMLGDQVTYRDERGQLIEYTVGLPGQKKMDAMGANESAPTNADGTRKSPTDDVGKPPQGKNGEENEWEVKPGDEGGDGKRTKWTPKYPVPSISGEQPSVSWDPNGHWDNDHWDPERGKQVRTRYLPNRGGPCDHDGKPLRSSTWNKVQSMLPPWVVGTGTAGIIIYLIISEGSRFVFPIRNAIPVW